MAVWKITEFIIAGIKLSHVCRCVWPYMATLSCFDWFSLETLKYYWPAQQRIGGEQSLTRWPNWRALFSCALFVKGMGSDYRADKSGFAREVQMRIAEKYSPEEAAKTLRWIRLLKPSVEVPDSLNDAVEKIPADIASVSAEDFYTFLKDGLVLGYLMACLKPTETFTKAMWKVSDKAIFETNRQRERIGAFINFCQEMGVGSASAFQTDQLHERTNLPQVVICLSQLGIEMQTKPDYKGPEGYWMNRHTENRRTFTEEQLKAGESVIGLQMGYNRGANQSGITFGAQRKVTDMY